MPRNCFSGVSFTSEEEEEGDEVYSQDVEEVQLLHLGRGGGGEALEDRRDCY